MVKWGLEKLVQLYDLFAESVQKSKQKDDNRGPKIIDDYSFAHSPAAVSDHVVYECKKVAEYMKVHVKSYLDKNVDSLSSSIFTSETKSKFELESSKL